MEPGLVTAGVLDHTCMCTQPDADKPAQVAGTRMTPLFLEPPPTTTTAIIATVNTNRCHHDNAPCSIRLVCVALKFTRGRGFNDTCDDSVEEGQI